MLARTRAKATTHTHNFGNLAPQQRLMTLCFAVAAAASLSLSLYFQQYDGQEGTARRAVQADNSLRRPSSSYHHYHHQGPCLSKREG